LKGSQFKETAYSLTNDLPGSFPPLSFLPLGFSLVYRFLYITNNGDGKVLISWSFSDPCQRFVYDNRFWIPPFLIIGHLVSWITKVILLTCKDSFVMVDATHVVFFDLILFVSDISSLFLIVKVFPFPVGQGFNRFVRSRTFSDSGPSHFHFFSLCD